MFHSLMQSNSVYSNKSNECLSNLILDGNCLEVSMWYKVGQRGCRVLVVDGFSYNRNRHTDDKTYWICSRKVRCFGYFFLTKKNSPVKLNGGNCFYILLTTWFVHFSLQGSTKCRARVITSIRDNCERVIYKSFEHNHPQKAADLKSEWWSRRSGEAEVFKSKFERSFPKTSILTARHFYFPWRTGQSVLPAIRTNTNTFHSIHLQIIWAHFA